MTILKTILTGAVILGISACSSFESHHEIEDLNNASAAGSPFTQQLTNEYRAFANYELDQGDYADALHFSRKGLSAAEGHNVMPEPVHDWNLSLSDIDELSTAYARLITAFDMGAREVLPGKSAIAQARYDCWIEEQEEISHGRQEDQSVPCKDDFMAVMAEVEAALPNTAAVQEFPEPVQMIDTAEPLDIQEAMYLVFFDFDSSTLNSDGISVIDAVVNEITSRNIGDVHIVGHTDTTGSNTYNASLANQRANSVKDALTARGITANSITIEGRGEKELLVDTEDGIREPANRRAVITFK